MMLSSYSMMLSMLGRGMVGQRRGRAAVRMVRGLLGAGLLGVWGRRWQTLVQRWSRGADPVRGWAPASSARGATCAIRRSAVGMMRRAVEVVAWRTSTWGQKFLRHGRISRISGRRIRGRLMLHRMVLWWWSTSAHRGGTVGASGWHHARERMRRSHLRRWTSMLLRRMRDEDSKHDEDYFRQVYSRRCARRPIQRPLMFTIAQKKKSIRTLTGH